MLKAVFPSAETGREGDNGNGNQTLAMVKKLAFKVDISSKID
jgi:hypothetical protein